MDANAKFQFQRLQEGLPFGWSWIASRTGGGPYRFSAFSARRNLSTEYSTDIDAVIDEAWALDTDPGEQLTMSFDQVVTP